jgi:hypothetical protein
LRRLFFQFLLNFPLHLLFLLELRQAVFAILLGVEVAGFSQHRGLAAAVHVGDDLRLGDGQCLG